MNDFPFYKQTTKYSCGIFCVKSLIKYYGDIIEIDKYLNNENTKGVSVYELCGIIEEFNYHSYSFKFDRKNFENLKHIKDPIIIHWNNNHYVILYKFSKGKYFISNPKTGLEIYEEEEFKEKVFNSDEEGYFIRITKKIDNTQKNASFIDVAIFIWRHLKPYKKSIRYVVLIISIISLIYSILPFITRSVIDIGVGTKDYNFIIILLVSNVIFILFKSIGEWIKTSILVNISSRMRIAIVSDYLEKILNLPINVILGLVDGDIIQRSKDQERIQQFISNSAINILMALSILSIYSIILFFFNKVLFYIFFSFNIIFIIWIISFFKIRKKIDINYYQTLGNNESTWINILSSFEDIKLNNLSLKKRKEWENIQIDTHNAGIKLMKVDRIQQLGSEFINSIKDLFLSFYGAYLVIQGEISFGTLISIQFILSQVNNPVLEVINFIKMFQSSMISFSRVNQIKVLPNEQDTNINHINNIDNENILFRNVSYRYNDKSKLILKNVNLFIKKNKLNIIVGKSGSGKTTILKLISTSYLNYYGDILLGNFNVKNIDLHYLRSNLGVCYQDSKLYNDTILNNIILNNEYNKILLNKVLKETNLFNEILSLEKGLHTTLDTYGKGLSDGQKQRLILARALYKQPKILILDEITSNLDVLNENHILNSIKNMKINTTIIMSSHSPSSLKIADNIIVIDDGLVVEQGSYEYLLNNQNSKFSTLFNLNKPHE